MRYDMKAVFYRIGPEKYDPNTGSMTATEAVVGSKMCSIYDLSSTERITLLGRMDVKGLTLHHQGHVIAADAVLVGSKRYWVRSSRSLNHKASYVLEEAKS